MKTFMFRNKNVKDERNEGKESAMNDWDLFDALEMHGEGHGTEEQLNVTTDLLMEAVDTMPGYALAKFMEYAKEKLEEVK